MKFINKFLISLLTVTFVATQSFGALTKIPRAMITNAVVQSKTTTYTALTSDDVINASASGGAWTLALYPVSGNAGRSLIIKKTDSTLNAITIDPNASEQIEGATTTTLNTINESVTIYCDGTAWYISNRTIPSKWVSYTPTITGWTSNTSVSFFSRRVGANLEVRGGFTAGTSNASTAQIGLGFNGTANNVTADASIGFTAAANVVGQMIYNQGSASSFHVILPTTNQTYVNLGQQNAGNSGFAAMTGTNQIGSGATAAFLFSVPIVGWNN